MVENKLSCLSVGLGRFGVTRDRSDRLPGRADLQLIDSVRPLRTDREANMRHTGIDLTRVACACHLLMQDNNNHDIAAMILQSLGD